ncbi:hypothetical protein [Asticcacaulis sp. AND118]|nr:hypothetical protein [Asticcacaulis sp. AND118]
MAEPVQNVPIAPPSSAAAPERLPATPAAVALTPEEEKQCDRATD